MKRIVEFEALRGFLALWVVVGHVLKACGYAPENFGPLGFVAMPGLAVDVFIILSGFVIFNLLDQQNQSYRTFIVQRFCRLYPLYLLAIAASIAVAGLKLAWLARLPWHGPYSGELVAIAQSSLDHLPEHTAAHLTMLHGLIPDSLLPYSEYGVLGQAWSISVEWQFYLVAPLLLLLLRKSPLGLAAAILAIAALRSRYWLGEGFAVNQAGYFTIGIVSYFAYRWLHAREISLGTAAIAVALAASVAFFFTTRPLSLALWAVFFAAALVRNNPLSAICNWVVARWCGQISYSIYLVHFVVLVIASMALLALAPGFTQGTHATALMLLTVAGTLAVSSLTWRFVEKPGIDFGRYLTVRRPIPAALGQKI